MRDWVGDPIDVVQMQDGSLVAIDNKRLLAADMVSQYRPDFKVKADVHDFEEMITPSRAQDFLEQYGTKPATWGDAVNLRIGDQGAKFSNTYPNGSPFTGVGSPVGVK